MWDIPHRILQCLGQWNRIWIQSITLGDLQNRPAQMPSNGLLCPLSALAKGLIASASLLRQDW